MALNGTSWSIDLRDADSGEVLFQHEAHETLKTASVAKIFLLVEVAARIDSGALDPNRLLDRRSVDPVADSGLWQFLAQRRLPVADAARLVGAVSDNLATNVLLDLVGLDGVRARAAALAPDGSALHDAVRNVRRRGDAPTLSTGTASDWASFFAGLRQKSVVSPAVSGLVLDWLAPGVDVSMVGSAFGLDPLAHAGLVDRGVALWNKTGTDNGVRADVGLFEYDGRALAYAAICNWDPAIRPDPRDDVLVAMRSIGVSLRSRDF